MYKIDKKDMKLLLELDINSRQSIQQLAKKVGLSKDAIQYRIKKHQAAGVIKTFRATIDTGKLGLIGFRVLLKFRKTSPKKEEEIKERLLKNKHLMWAVEVKGSWDMTLWFPYKTINQFYEEVWNDLIEKFGNYIDKKEFGITNKIIYFSRDHLFGGSSTKKTLQIQISSLPEIEKIDNKDIEILKLLTKDARMSIVEISKKINISTKTVLSRIRKLEKIKIIVGYRTEFDMNKLGYFYYKLHLNLSNTTPEKTNQIKRFIYTSPITLYWDEIIGGSDIEADLQMKDKNELELFIKELKTRFNEIIQSYEVLTYSREIVEKYFPVI